jgi:hypothetical protein
MDGDAMIDNREERINKTVAQLNKFILPTFRVVLILVMIYAVIFSFLYFRTITHGNPFIYGATQLQGQAGSPIFCTCTTPKGNLCFNTSYMSAIGSVCLPPQQAQGGVWKGLILNLTP